MDLEDINVTIRELEQQIAAYEFEERAHSTPAGTSRPQSQITPNSGIAIAQFLEDDGAGNKKKSVRLGSKTVNAFAKNDYDISPYLHRNEKQIPTDVPRAPVENITFRRKTRSQTREEPRLPDIQDTSCVDPSASRKNAPNIKPATYDGTTSWLDYKSHFEACAKLGKLDETEKGWYLSFLF